LFAALPPSACIIRIVFFFVSLLVPSTDNTQVCAISLDFFESHPGQNKTYRKMKFSMTSVMAMFLAEQAAAFASYTALAKKCCKTKGSGQLFMAIPVDMPPLSDLPVIQQISYGVPADVRYSDFLKLVNADRIDKVTFSADGTQLLGVDVKGVRVKIESLPNDPSLLTELTTHKVRRKSDQ
jgi:hypothetical protein